MKIQYFGFVWLFISGFFFASVTEVFAISSGYQVGTFQVETKGSDGVIRMGSVAPIAQFRIQNQGKKDMVLDFLELKNYENADLTTSFSDWGLVMKDSVVPALWTVNRKNIRVQLLEPILIGRGDSIIVTVQAKLVLAKYGQAVRLGFRNKEDIGIKELSTNFYAELINPLPFKFRTQSLRMGGIYFFRQSRRTFRR